MNKTMIAIVGVVMVGLTAQAADWFNGGIESGWPNATSMSGGAWSNETSGVYKEGRVIVSAETNAPLSFVAIETKKLADDVVTVTSQLTFTPFSTLPPVPENAKAGVISVKDGATTNFYVLGKSAEAKAWVKTAMPATTEAEVKVTFLDGSKVIYTIGENAPSTNDIVIAETIERVCMSGDGAIASLVATTESKGGGIIPSEQGTVEIKGTGKDAIAEITPKEGVQAITVTPPMGFEGKYQIPSSVTNITGVAIGNLIIKSGEFDIAAACKIETNGNILLDGTKTVEGVPVTPTIATSEGIEKPFVVGDGVSTTIRTIPGLYYSLVKRNTVGSETVTIVACQQADATGKTELKEETKTGTQAFYTILVTIQEMEPVTLTLGGRIWQTK